MAATVFRQIYSLLFRQTATFQDNTTHFIQRCSIWQRARPKRQWKMVAMKKKYVPMGYPDLPDKPIKNMIKPVKFLKTGGRDLDSGKVVNAKLGGGTKKDWYILDYQRRGLQEGQTFQERVVKVQKDPIRTADFALVANGNNRRYIIATDGIKEGDIIKTTEEIPRLSVNPVNGDAHPIGALPMGTMIHHIEKYPGEGGHFCRAGGTFAKILRKVGEKCLIRLPSKHEVLLDKKCMAVVGAVSNGGHNEIPWDNFAEKRRAGYRPRTGWWHRKIGYSGKKVKRYKTYTPKARISEESLYSSVE